VGAREYEVWDYKTGSARRYQDPKAYRQGRVLQHALYAQAAKRVLQGILGAEVRVVRSGYFFASPKGEGERISRTPGDWQNLGEVLSLLFEMLRQGVFPAGYDKPSCGYCDYKAACGGVEAVERTLAKMGDARLEPLRRLKDGV